MGRLDNSFIFILFSSLYSTTSYVAFSTTLVYLMIEKSSSSSSHHFSHDNTLYSDTVNGPHGADDGDNHHDHFDYDGQVSFDWLN